MKQRVIYDQRPKPSGIAVIGESTPTFPKEFQRRLQALDKDLLITWHRPPFWPPHRRGVWKIEHCIEHHGKGFDLQGTPIHDHTCRRGYVLMCQDAEAVPMPLGEWIFQKLGEMRGNWEAFGGNTERGVKNALAESSRIEHEMVQKREAASEDVKRYNRKDKRIQINKLMHLIEQHDLRPNK
jgi:hypothetical protein